MAFTRVHTWAANEKLTSAQMNALDTDHANSVDKTGDTINAGTITVSGTGKIASGVAGGIASSVAGGIQSSAAGGVEIVTPGGLQLDGPTNWPQFDATRIKPRVVSPIIYWSSNPASWSIPTFNLVGAAAVDKANIEITPFVHHGAVLSTVDCFISVTGAHGSVPSVLPKLNVKRVQALVAGAALTTVVNLSSAGGALFTPTPGSGAAWDASHNLQKWSVTCDQNNNIDRTQYRYYIELTDENGSNSVAGNQYLGFVLNHAGIANMAFD